MENVPLSVSDAIALINQTLEYAYPVVLIEGEIASFKVNKEKFVFFDIKDASGTLGCFMTVYQLRISLEDGMKVRIVAAPKLTQWGRFSLTVRDVQPVGAGSLKRAFELLRETLDKEGLFSAERKRLLPYLPERIGVVTSTQAAGYADFVKILSERWGGLEIIVANTQVQGMTAPRQIVRAIEHFNQMAEPPEVIALIRGGGSADDLVAFNDEPLVRAIAASRVPVIVGVGHDTDTSLCDMVADVSAVTPTNAAQLLVPDKIAVIETMRDRIRHMLWLMERRTQLTQQHVGRSQLTMFSSIVKTYDHKKARLQELSAVVKQLDPSLALRRGYAIVTNTHGEVIGSKVAPIVGQEIAIDSHHFMIKAGVTHVTKK